MKVFKQEPTYFIRLQIVQQKSDTQYLTLVETTREEVTEMVKGIISKNASPIITKGMTRTQVHIREAWGAKNGKSQSVSFYGLDPLQILNLILQEVA